VRYFTIYSPITQEQNGGNIQASLGGSVAGLIILVAGGTTSIRQLIINRKERND
jgi:hypothetical protein